MFPITALAASVLALLYVKLAFVVIGYRRKNKVSVGDGGDEQLQQRIRAHANLTEYAPIGLILLACLEANQAPWWLTLILAATFCAGRFLHPIGMMNPEGNFIKRIQGMQLTLTSLIALSVINIALVIWRLFA